MKQQGWTALPLYTEGIEPTTVLKIYDARLANESQYVYTKSTRELKKVLTLFNQYLCTLFLVLLSGATQLTVARRTSIQNGQLLCRPKQLDGGKF